MTNKLPVKKNASVPIGSKAWYVGTHYDAVDINEWGSLTHPAVWRGVRRIQNTVAKIPLQVLKDEGSDTEEDWRRDKNHAAYRLLRRRINPGKSPSMTSYQWLKTSVFHATIWGNAFAMIIRNPTNGQPVRLKMLPPDSVWMHCNGSETWYAVQYYDDNNELKVERIAPDDMIHFRGLSFDGQWGLPWWKYAKETIETGVAPRAHAKKYFEKGAMSSGLLYHPTGWSEEVEARMIESFRKQYEGLGNAQSTMVLEETLKFEPLSHEPLKSQMIEARRYSNKEVNMFLGLEDDDQSSISYNSEEMKRQNELDFSYDPWLNEIETECSEKLLTEQQKRTDSHKIVFRREAYIKADTQTTWNTVLGGVNGGLLTPNQGLGILDLPRSEDERADQLRIPTGVYLETALPEGDEDDPTPPPEMVPVVVAPEPEEPEEQPEEAETSEAARNVLRDAIRRANKKLATQIKKAAKTLEGLHTLLYEEPKQLYADYAATIQPAAELFGLDAQEVAVACVDRITAILVNDLQTIDDVTQLQSKAREYDPCEHTDLLIGVITDG